MELAQIKNERKAFQAEETLVEMNLECFRNRKKQTNETSAYSGQGSM